MKKKLKIAGIGVVGFIAVLFLVALFLPSEFRVSREVVVQAPPEQVFALVENLHYYNKWSPWAAADPTMQLTFSDPPAGEGAWFSWSSEDSGHGKMTIRKTVPSRLVATEFDFKGGKMTMASDFELAPVAEGTRVTWSIYGDDGGHVLHRYFAMIMDTIVGSNCDNGLDNLKALAEKQPAMPAPEPSQPPEEAPAPEEEAADKEG